MKQPNYEGVLQHPIRSGFNANSSSSEVIKGINLTGKIAIVTGGNSGIGLETVKTLAGAGATVIVPARDTEKAIRNLTAIPNVEIEAMDLSDPDSISNFADKFLASNRPLHLLINNAGIMWVPLRRNAKGIESQLATNFLAPYQLTIQLMPALIKAGRARVVNVSSQGHQFAPFNFEDPNFEQREYETLQAYGQSKTALNLFTVELDNRVRKFGVRAYSLNPGAIGGTELAREAPLELFINMGFCDQEGNILPEVAATLKTIPQGASTSIWCATSPLLENIGGVYCEDTEIATIASDTEISAGVRKYSLNESAAKKLLELSEQLTGVGFQRPEFAA